MAAPGMTLDSADINMATQLSSQQQSMPSRELMSAPTRVAPRVGPANLQEPMVEAMLEGASADKVSDRGVSSRTIITIRRFMLRSLAYPLETLTGSAAAPVADAVLVEQMRYKLTAAKDNLAIKESYQQAQEFCPECNLPATPTEAIDLFERLIESADK